MPASVAAGRRHLPLRLLQVHDPGADLGDAVLGHDQGLAEALVEAAGDLPHQLDVLALVVADRDLGGAVGEHVGGLQHRVEEERRRDQLALARRLVLELVHAVEVAVGGDRGEQPGQLGVLAHVGLAEEDAALGVEAGGEQDRGRVVEALAQLGRVVGDGDRVQVDDAVDRRVAAVLALDVLADRADVVAEVLAAGRLDAGEDDGRSRAAAYSGAIRGGVPLTCGLRRPADPRLGRETVKTAPPLPGSAPAARAGGAGSRSRSRRSAPPAIISTPAMPMPRWKDRSRRVGAALHRSRAATLPPATIGRSARRDASGWSLRAVEATAAPRPAQRPGRRACSSRHRRRSGPR